MAPAVHRLVVNARVLQRRVLATSLFLLGIAGLAMSLASAAQAAEAPGVRTLYLVRHGLYDQDDPRDAEVGKALVPLGREQAALAGARLASLPVKFTALYSSTMTRARETAVIVGEALHLQPQLSRDLCECTPPTRRADIMAGLRPGEADSCVAQIDRAYAQYFKPSPAGDVSEVIVCHGNVIRYCVCRALGVDTQAWLGMTIANCSLTVMQVKPDGSVRLVSYDDVGHIPPAQQTYTTPAKMAAAPVAAPAK
jgi:serine/threonine-protein phosphatase PGAM5